MSELVSLNSNSTINKVLTTASKALSQQANISDVDKKLVVDTIAISKQGAEIQQQESQLSAATNREIANDMIRVSSTIGKSQSVGNLTNNQATELYEQIAKLL
ncbi:hypothetical protein [Litorilituus sediminis]|uniref:Uncharacterized protein n=1 Tax=Litorilituus sediminis TaxID=718192 RepID=A0A4P6P525_9GAMM|nr:hypothetical protein [Litorilituus sediminis]QBG35209.1 hypothetical protein EMK97_05495 [Litorilituus sediminis]